MRLFIQKIKCLLGAHAWYAYEIIDNYERAYIVHLCLACYKVHTKEIPIEES